MDRRRRCCLTICGIFLTSQDGSRSRFDLYLSKYVVNIRNICGADLQRPMSIRFTQLSLFENLTSMRRCVMGLLPFATKYLLVNKWLDEACERSCEHLRSRNFEASRLTLLYIWQLSILTILSILLHHHT